MGPAERTPVAPTMCVMCAKMIQDQTEIHL